MPELASPTEKNMMKLLDLLDDCTPFHKDMVGKPTSTGKTHYMVNISQKRTHIFWLVVSNIFFIFTPILGDS